MYTLFVFNDCINYFSLVVNIILALLKRFGMNFFHSFMLNVKSIAGQNFHCLRKRKSPAQKRQDEKTLITVWK